MDGSTLFTNNTSLFMIMFQALIDFVLYVYIQIRFTWRDTEFLFLVSIWKSMGTHVPKQHQINGRQINNNEFSMCCAVPVAIVVDPFPIICHFHLFSGHWLASMSVQLEVISPPFVLVCAWHQPTACTCRCVQTRFLKSTVGIVGCSFVCLGSVF